MDQIFKIEQVGTYVEEGGGATVLRTAPDFKTGTSRLGLIYDQHLEDVSDICRNRPNKIAQTIKAIKDIGESRIISQRIQRKGGKFKHPLVTYSFLELDDGTKYNNVITQCTTPFSLVYGGEIMGVGDLFKSRKEVKTGVEKIEEMANKDLDNFITSALLIGVGRMTYKMIEEIENKVKFYDIEDLNYNPQTEEPHVVENDYSTWELIDAEITPSTIGLSIIGTLKEVEKDRELEIMLPDNIPIFENLDKRIDKAWLKEGIKRAGIFKMEDCNTLLDYLIKKNEIEIEGVYLNGKVCRTPFYYAVSGRSKPLFEPSNSLITLNGSERRTVETTYDWAMALGSKSNRFKIETSNLGIEIPVK